VERDTENTPLSVALALVTAAISGFALGSTVASAEVVHALGATPLVEVLVLTIGVTTSLVTAYVVAALRRSALRFASSVHERLGALEARSASCDCQKRSKLTPERPVDTIGTPRRGHAAAHSEDE